MSWSTLQSAIYDWLKTILTTENVVWDRQNAGQPAKPYVTLNIDVLTRIGEDYVSRPGPNGMVTVIGNRDFTLMIQYFGSGAMDKMENIRLATNNPLSLEILQASGIAFVSAEPIMDLTALKQNGYEERAGLDLHMRTDASSSSLAVGSVGSVAIEKRFMDSGLEYQSTGAIMIENIEIP